MSLIPIIPTSVQILIALAIAPSGFLLWFFYHANRYKHESPKLMFVTFLLGAVSIIPAIIIELVLKDVLSVFFSISSYPNIQTLGELISTFLYFLIGVGLVEESMKFLSIRVYAYKSPRFDEPMDGVVLGVAAALGFATIENLLYVFQSGLFQIGLLTAIVRAFVSVPGHALYGAILGFYLGEAKFHRKSYLAIKGLAIAIFLHGLFDTISTILLDFVGLAILFIFILVVYFKIVRGEIKEAENESPRRRPWRQCGRIFLFSLQFFRRINIFTVRMRRPKIYQKVTFVFFETRSYFLSRKARVGV